MPPRSKITRDMVVEAAFALARRQGVEQVNPRAVAQELGCSTQPVMYHFATIQELKQTVHEKADAYHTQYLLTVHPPQGNLLLGIGLNYIRFAIREPHLFRLLFQSGMARQTSLLEMIEAPELTPVLSAMAKAMALSLSQAKEVFLTIALFAHGYASILANNHLAYDEALITAHLERAYRGARLAAAEDHHEKPI